MVSVDDISQILLKDQKLRHGRSDYHLHLCIRSQSGDRYKALIDEVSKVFPTESYHVGTIPDIPYFSPIETVELNKETKELYTSTKNSIRGVFKNVVDNENQNSHRPRTLYLKVDPIPPRDYQNPSLMLKLSEKPLLHWLIIVSDASLLMRILTEVTRFIIFDNKEDLLMYLAPLEDEEKVKKGFCDEVFDFLEEYGDKEYFMLDQVEMCVNRIKF